MYYYYYYFGRVDEVCLWIDRMDEVCLWIDRMDEVCLWIDRMDEVCLALLDVSSVGRAAEHHVTDLSPRAGHAVFTLV